MMNATYGNERGSVLVHVTIAIIGLVAISALTIDAGVKWISRGQAQNAADAGALAGAVALSFDDPDDLTDTGVAKQSARAYALSNLVWGEAPDVEVSTDVTFPPCPDGSPDTCVKVDVYRNQARLNPLPTFSSRLVGVLDQGVRATAMAQVRTGNASNCLKPWAIIDRWDEFNGTEPDYPGPDPDFGPLSTFDRYSTGRGNLPPQENDLYVPPSPTEPGTGFHLPDDFGRQFGIKTDSGSDAISSGWFRAIDLPRVDEGNLGADAYRANIRTCNGYPVGIAAPETQCPVGSAISTFQQKVDWAAQGCVRVETGNMVGPTIQGIQDLFNTDPYAYWDNTNRRVVSTQSPSSRIVPIAIMDINAYMALDPSGSGTSLKIVNILGFFIEGMGDIDRNTGAIIFNPRDPMNPGNKVVVGRLVTVPGLDLGTSTPDEDSAFLRTILLVR